MQNRALVVIDIQNDITKHYKDVIDNINAAIEWAQSGGMHIVYIKHNNISAGTRTFKPDSKGAELAPELEVVSDNIFIKTKANALTSEPFAAFIAENAGKTYATHYVRPVGIKQVKLHETDASVKSDKPEG